MQKLFISGFFLFSLIFTACHDIEKKTMNGNEAQTLLTESVTASFIYSSTQEDATRAGLQIESSVKSAPESLSEYPVITVDPHDLTTWPKTITIDYGPENISSIDGHTRRGVMIVNAFNFPTVEDASWIIDFDEYYFDDYKVEGTQSVKYTGENSSGHPVYNCTLSEGVITSPDNKVFYFEQLTNREFVSGYNTHFDLTGNQEDFCDDEYKITGTHSGVSSEGYIYTMSTTEPLLANVCCKWIMDGKLKVDMPDAELDCEIDYHPGPESGDLCNNEAVFTIFGISVPITLR